MWNVQESRGSMKSYSTVTHWSASPLILFPFDTSSWSWRNSSYLCSTTIISRDLRTMTVLMSLWNDIGLVNFTQFKWDWFRVVWLCWESLFPFPFVAVVLSELHESLSWDDDEDMMREFNPNISGFSQWTNCECSQLTETSQFESHVALSLRFPCQTFDFREKRRKLFRWENEKFSFNFIVSRYFIFFFVLLWVRVWGDVFGWLGIVKVFSEHLQSHLYDVKMACGENILLVECWNCDRKVERQNLNEKEDWGKNFQIYFICCSSKLSTHNFSVAYWTFTTHSTHTARWGYELLISRRRRKPSDSESFTTNLHPPPQNWWRQSHFENFLFNFYFLRFSQSLFVAFPQSSSSSFSQLLFFPLSMCRRFCEHEILHSIQANPLRLARFGMCRL